MYSSPKKPDVVEQSALKSAMDDLIVEVNKVSNAPLEINSIEGSEILIDPDVLSFLKALAGKKKNVAMAIEQIETTGGEFIKVNSEESFRAMLKICQMRTSQVLSKKMIT